MTMSEPHLAQITLRLAVQADCRPLWQWRNEPLTREASFDTNLISYEDHEHWFSRKLNSPDMRIFIIVNADGRDMGYARFSIDREEAEISVSLDESLRGKGHGAAAIRLASDRVISSGSVVRVLAYIKPDNPASIAAFQRAGFVPQGVKELSGAAAHVMVYGGCP